MFQAHSEVRDTASIARAGQATRLGAGLRVGSGASASESTSNERGQGFSFSGRVAS
jgi:hypothetical protein